MNLMVKNNYKKKTEEMKGITLIALVVTIIILIILAGISISVLTGQNGILNRAIEAKEKTELSSEKEVIQYKIIQNQMQENLSSSDERVIGIPLHDKTVNNENEWNIIYSKNENKTYGTGWYYLKEGTEVVDYGELRSDWIINYSTGEIIELEEKEFTNLQYGDNLAITDNLIFDLEPTITEDTNKENVQEKLGENVELINFDWNDESGISKTSFNLDGKDDYIKVLYDSKEQKNTLIENGYTFEFYGIIDEGNSYDSSKNNITQNSNYQGIFCYWNGYESAQALFRFGITKDKNSIKWNASGLGREYKSDFANKNFPWNIEYNNIYTPKEKVYYTISLDCSENYSNNDGFYKATCYKNGIKVYEGGYDKENWNNLKITMDALKYFCVGRSSMTNDGWWHYSKMNIFALRLYNKGLDENEVKENYKKTVAYYNLVKDNLES